MNIEKSFEYLKNCLNDEYNYKNATRKKDKQAIETLLTAYNDIKTEHKIMKRIIVENGLWKRLLNDDEFIKHLEEE